MKKSFKMILFILMVSMETVIDWIGTNIVQRFFSGGNCIEKIYSVSIVVGSSDCNANCRHCGGRSSWCCSSSWPYRPSLAGAC